MNLLKLVKEKVELITEKEPDILAVFLLESALGDALRSDSDIGLGIILEPGTRLEALKRIEIAGTLSYELGRIVDMGEISSKNLVYAREALLKGILLYQRDRDKVNMIRTNLLGIYIQFNMDRREVVNACITG